MSPSGVILGPCYGEDAAVLETNWKYLVVKTDPITFTAERHSAPRIVTAFRRHRNAASIIGEICGAKNGISTIENGRAQAIVFPERDEIAPCWSNGLLRTLLQLLKFTLRHSRSHPQQSSFIALARR